MQISISAVATVAFSCFAYRINGQNVGIIVFAFLVDFFLCPFIAFVGIEINIIASRKVLISARQRGVLFRRTLAKKQEKTKFERI